MQISLMTWNNDDDSDSDSDDVVGEYSAWVVDDVSWALPCGKP